MDQLFIFNKEWQKVLVIDDYYSLVWATRFQEMGDFTLELPTEFSYSPYLEFGNYVVRPGTPEFMIIEDVNPVHDSEGSSKFVVTGRSGISWLTRRIVTDELYVDGKAAQAIYVLINENFVNPTDPSRALSGFGIENVYTSLGPDINDVYFPGTVYEIVKVMAEEADLGFTVIFRTDEGDVLVRLYEGVDRSLYQLDNPAVIFSDEFDNVLSSDYQASTSGNKNVAVITTNDLVHPLVTVWIGDEPTGLNRRELLMDASDLTRDSGPGSLGDAAYLALVQQRGIHTLFGYRSKGIFDGQVDIFSTFKYGEDFSMGDLTQCIFDGRSKVARVVELIETVDSYGSNAYISFDFDP